MSNLVRIAIANAQTIPSAAVFFFPSGANLLVEKPGYGSYDRVQTDLGPIDGEIATQALNDVIGAPPTENWATSIMKPVVIAVESFTSPSDTKFSLSAAEEVLPAPKNKGK